MFRNILPWTGTLGLALVLALAARAEESIEVTATGTLRTGVFAIGAETTGVTIKVKDITWELDLGKDEALQAAAVKLNGQPATITGTLERRAGVEVKERWIVTVKTLREAAEKPKQPADLEAVGAHEGTKSSIVTTAEQTIVDIRCERGIDRCELKRLRDAWPAKVVLHLRLSGLESLQVSHGNASLSWSVSSTGDPSSNCAYSSGKRVVQLQPGDPLYSAAALVSEKENAAPKIPLQGYFAITIPGKFLESNPEQLRIQWIDFYR